MKKFFEIYFMTLMTITAIMMFLIVALLVVNNIMGFPAKYIFDFSLLCGFIGGFVPTMGELFRHKMSKPS